jgi:hypothetical protein
VFIEAPLYIRGRKILLDEKARVLALEGVAGKVVDDF